MHQIVNQLHQLQQQLSQVTQDIQSMQGRLQSVTGQLQQINDVSTNQQMYGGAGVRTGYGQQQPYATPSSYGSQFAQGSAAGGYGHLTEPYGSGTNTGFTPGPYGPSAYDPQRGPTSSAGMSTGTNTGASHTGASHTGSSQMTGTTSSGYTASGTGNTQHALQSVMSADSQSRGGTSMLRQSEHTSYGRTV